MEMNWVYLATLHSIACRKYAVTFFERRPSPSNLLRVLALLVYNRGQIPFLYSF